MTPLPRAIDLSAVADHLAPDPKFRAFVNTIRRTGAAKSCWADLTEAQACSDMIEAFLAGDARVEGNCRVEPDTHLMALLATGVNLYARATGTFHDLDERGSITLNTKWSASEREDHDALIDLRKGALAHVMPNQLRSGDYWHLSKEILYDNGKHWEPVSAERTMRFNAQQARRLARQVPPARRMMAEEYEERHAKMIAKLLEHYEDPALREAFAVSELDLVAFFGSEEMARQALSFRGHEGMWSFRTPVIIQ